MSFSSANRHHADMDVGPAEMLVILVIVVLLFGAERLPRLARSLGQAMHELHAGAREGIDHEQDHDQDER